MSDPGRLRAILWQLVEAVSGRMKKAGLAGRDITLELKQGNQL